MILLVSHLIACATGFLVGGAFMFKLYKHEVQEAYKLKQILFPHNTHSQPKQQSILTTNLDMPNSIKQELPNNVIKLPINIHIN